MKTIEVGQYEIRGGNTAYVKTILPDGGAKGYILFVIDFEGNEGVINLEWDKNGKDIEDEDYDLIRKI